METPKNSDYKLKRYLHLPTGKVYKLNGVGGIIREDNSTNVSLPIWLIYDSKDWLLIVDENGKLVKEL